MNEGGHVHTHSLTVTHSQSLTHSHSLTVYIGLAKGRMNHRSLPPSVHSLTHSQLTLTLSSLSAHTLSVHSQLTHSLSADTINNYRPIREI